MNERRKKKRENRKKGRKVERKDGKRERKGKRDVGKEIVTEKGREVQESRISKCISVTIDIYIWFIFN